MSLLDNEHFLPQLSDSWVLEKRELCLQLQEWGTSNVFQYVWTCPLFLRVTALSGVPR